MDYSCVALGTDLAYLAEQTCLNPVCLTGANVLGVLIPQFAEEIGYQEGLEKVLIGATAAIGAG